MLHISFWQRQNKREGIVCGTNKQQTAQTAETAFFLQSISLDTFPRLCVISKVRDVWRALPAKARRKKEWRCTWSTLGTCTYDHLRVSSPCSDGVHLHAVTFMSPEVGGYLGQIKRGVGALWHADQQLPVPGKISSHQPPAAIRKHYSAAIISNMGNSDLFRETDSICSACGTWMKMNEHEVRLSKMSS